MYVFIWRHRVWVLSGTVVASLWFVTFRGLFIMLAEREAAGAMWAWGGLWHLRALAVLSAMCAGILSAVWHAPAWSQKMGRTTWRQLTLCPFYANAGISCLLIVLNIKILNWENKIYSLIKLFGDLFNQTLANDRGLQKTASAVLFRVNVSHSNVFHACFSNNMFSKRFLKKKKKNPTSRETGFTMIHNAALALV